MKIEELKKLSSEELKLHIEKMWLFGRRRLARHGIGLDILANDKYSSVRTEVARAGYGLDKLINDKSIFVSTVASNYLVSKRMSLDTWVQENPNKCVFFDSINGNTPNITNPFARGTDLLLQRAEQRRAQHSIDSTKAREPVEQTNNMSERINVDRLVRAAFEQEAKAIPQELVDKSFNKFMAEFQKRQNGAIDGRMNMFFNDAEKGLIEKGLNNLREKLESNRSFFEMGSVQREQIENKIDAICDLRNNLYKSEFSQIEKNVIFEALDGMKENFIKNRSIFDVGSVQREQLEANIDRIDNIKNNINNAKELGSLDSFINAAKQQQSNQPFQNVPQRNNDLVI